MISGKINMIKDELAIYECLNCFSDGEVTRISCMLILYTSIYFSKIIFLLSYVFIAIRIHNHCDCMSPKFFKDNYYDNQAVIQVI